MDENKFNLANLAKTLLANVEKTDWNCPQLNVKGEKIRFVVGVEELSIILDEFRISIIGHLTSVRLNATTDDEKKILKRLYTTVMNKHLKRKKGKANITKKILRVLGN